MSDDAADQPPGETPVDPPEVPENPPSSEPVIDAEASVEDPDGYAQHRISAIFPEMSADEFDALCEDIRQNGLLVPIDVVGKWVIDGWHRYRACGIVGCKRRFNEIDPEVDLLVFAASKNLKRRHLPVGALSIIGSEMAEASHGGDRKSANLRVARAARTAKDTDSSLPNEDGEDENQSVLKHFDFSDPTNPAAEENARLPGELIIAPVSIEDAAKTLGISRSSVALGRKVTREGVDDVRDAVRNSKVSLKVGADISKLPKDEQKSALQKHLDKGAEVSNEEQTESNAIKKIVAEFKSGKMPHAAATPKQVGLAVSKLVIEATSALARVASASAAHERIAGKSRDIRPMAQWSEAVTLVNECSRVMQLLQPPAPR